MDSWPTGSGIGRDGSLSSGVHLFRPITGPSLSASSSNSSQRSGAALPRSSIDYHFEPRPKELVAIKGTPGWVAPTPMEIDSDPSHEEEKDESAQYLAGSDSSSNSSSSSNPAGEQAPQPFNQLEFPPFWRGPKGGLLKTPEKASKPQQVPAAPARKKKACTSNGETRVGGHLYEAIFDDDFYPSDESLLAIRGVDDPGTWGRLRQRQGPSTQGKGETTTATGCWLGGPGTGFWNLNSHYSNWTLEDIAKGDNFCYLAEAFEQFDLNAGGRGNAGGGTSNGLGLVPVCNKHIFCVLRNVFIYGSDSPLRRFVCNGGRFG